MSSRVGLRAHLVDGTAHEVVDVDHLRAGERVVALQPREVDDVLHEVAQPRGLHLHALGEVPDLVGVVARREDGLRQQRQGSDRGLELMADVRHEVASNHVDAALLGEVVDEDEDRPGAQRRHAHAELEQLAAQRWSPDAHLLLAGVAVVGDPLDEVRDVGDRHRVAVDEAQARGAGVGAQHRPVGSHDERGGRQDAEHPDDLVRDGGPQARRSTRPRGPLGRRGGQASRHAPRIGARRVRPNRPRPAAARIHGPFDRRNLLFTFAWPPVHPEPSDGCRAGLQLVRSRDPEGAARWFPRSRTSSTWSTASSSR